jgi:DNA-binding response OmpR family regulator
MERVVLIIDDDAPMRATLAQLLKRSGYAAVSAADGNEGLKVCRARAVDLVVTDLFMPNKEGIETIMELRRDFPKTPIIAISGMPDATPLLTTARILGAATTLAKPFEAEEFLTAVEEALRGSN